MIYVLDACALIAALNAEEGGNSIKALFGDADEGKITLVMSIINLLETYYGYVRDEGRPMAIEIMKPVYTSPLKIIGSISQRVYDEAARLKGTYRRISLADAVGIATAAELSAHFVTSDHHELEIVAEQEPVPFLWFR